MESTLKWKHGQYVIHHQAPEEDRAAALRQAKEMRNATQGYTPSRRMRFLMEVPPIVEMEMMNQYGRRWLTMHPREKLKLLKRGDYSGLYTTEGRF